MHVGVPQIVALAHQLQAEGGEALAAISVDGPASAEVRARLLQIPEIQSATMVSFRDT